MNSQKILNFCLLLAFVLAAFALGNYFFFKPALTIKLPQVQKLPPHKDAVAPAVRDLVATTMDKIRVSKKIKSEKKQPDQNQFDKKQKVVFSSEERNPFLWPQEIKQMKEAERDALIKAQYLLSPPKRLPKIKPHLKMVIVGKDKKIALLDDTLVFEGSFYKEQTVQRIYENEVVMTGDYDGELHVPLSEKAEEILPEELEPEPEVPKHKNEIQKIVDILEGIHDQEKTVIIGGYAKKIQIKELIKKITEKYLM